MKKVVLFAAIILSTFALIQLYYVYRIKPFDSLQDDGFVIISDEIYTDLKQGIDNAQTKHISLYQVNADDELYSNKVGGLFVGEEKQKVNIKYPMFVSDGSAVMNFNGNAMLITNDFENIETYSNLYLSNGVTFNSNKKQADLEDFILLKLANGLYINAQNTRIVNFLGQYDIPMNSIINFDEESINFYTFIDGKLTYDSIVPVDGTDITIGKNLYDYKHFLENLDIIKEEKISVNTSEDVTTTVDTTSETTETEQETEQETEVAEDTKPAQTRPVQTQMPQTQPLQTEGTSYYEEPVIDQNVGDQQITDELIDVPEEKLKYVKPDVTVESFSPWVYTVNSNLTINDPESRLTSGAKFYIYQNSKLVLRQSCMDSGEVKIGILMPDTQYKIVGKFKYKDDKNNTIEETFLEEQIITTLPIQGNVNPIDLSYSNSPDIFPNKIQIKDLYLDGTESSNQIMPYIGSVGVSINEDGAQADDIIITKIDTSSLKKLLSGQKVTWLSSEFLLSDTDYDYTINIYDKFKNILPTNPAEIVNTEVETCKKPPVAKLTLETNKISNVVISIDIDDVDNSLVDNLNLSIKDINGEDVHLIGKYSDDTPFSEKSIKMNLGKNKITITNLKIEEFFSCEVLCDYDINDGKGTCQSCLIGGMQFYTAPLSSLGYSYYTTTIPKEYLMDTSVKVDAELNTRTSKSILPLMTRITMTIKENSSETDDSPFFEYEFDKDVLESLTDANINEYNEIVLQDGDTVSPRISLKASSAEAFKYGAWQAILNGAIANNTADRAVIEVAFPTDSLSSATIYNIKYETIVSQGGQEADLTASSLKASFKTLKKEPWAEFKNAISTTNYFEIFGLNIKDPDDAVINGKLYAKVISNGLTIDSKLINTNQINNSLKFENLINNTTYTLEFVAPEFNNGYDQTYYKSLYKLTESYTFTTGESIEGALSLQQIDYISKTTPPTELYTQDTITLGAYISSGDKLYSGSSNFCTDYIKVSPSTWYMKKDFGQYYGTTFYDNDKNYISYSSYYGMGSVFKTPANAFYVRINGKIGYESKASLTQFKMVNNLIDFDNIQTGKKLVYNNTLQDNSLYYVTDYIPVVENSTYLKCQLGSSDVIFYDKDKAMISFNQYDSNGAVFTAPVGAAFVRLSGTNDKTDVATVYFVSEAKTDFYQAKILVSLIDKLNSLSINENPQFTLKFYRSDNTLIDYDEPEIINYPIHTYLKENGDICTENISQIIDKTVEANCSYKVELIIEVEGQETIIDTITFTTETAIIPIRTLDDLKDISKNPNGKYHVLNDLDIGNNGNFLGSTEFNGTLDFQGHRLTKTTTYNGNYMFKNIGTKGIVKNVIIDWNKQNNAYYNSTISEKNYGTISNVIVNIDSDSVDYNAHIGGITIDNMREGIIENFVVCLKQSLYCSYYFGGVSRINDGIIRNGYVYGNVANDAQIVAAQGYSTNTNHYAVAGITGVNNYNGIVENAYGLVSIQIQNGSNMQYAATIVGRNYGMINNTFTTGDRYVFTPVTQVGEKATFTLDASNGPAIGVSEGRSIVNNTFYISDNTYSSDSISKNTKIGKLALWDVSWYENIIGKSNKFIISDSVNLGYYPRVDLPSYMMPYQEFISIPKVIDSVRLNYVSNYVKEQNDDYAIAVLSFENPQYLSIKAINLIGLDCEILKQNWNNNVYQVEVKLSNPTMYFSQYEITDIVCGNSSVSVPVYYGESTLNGKLSINVEFYKGIFSVNDWYEINQGLNQNYRIKNDIDFINIDPLRINIGNGNKLTFTGKIDGGKYDDEGNLVGSYVLSNMNTGSYATVIYRLEGSVSNLTIDALNCSSELSAKQYYVGFIRESRNQSMVDGVTILNSKFKGCRYVGGLVAYTNLGQIVNSSVVSSVLDSYDYNNNSLQIGGLIGYSYNALVNNCFTSDISINSDGVYNCIGIGGLVGRVNGGASIIDNCYTQGEIYNVNGYTGAIVGNMEYGVITHCWAYVDLTSSSEYIGQIAGNVVSGTIENNLAIGNVYTRLYGSITNHRCIGNSEPNVSVQKNYAFENQLFNGSITTEMDDATRLLTFNELTNTEAYNNDIQLGEDFIYNEISSGMLPKLKSNYGIELPYQGDYYLVTNDVSIRVDQVKSLGVGDGTYSIQFTVIHPNYNIDNIVLESLTQTQDPKVIASGDATTYIYTVTQDNAYDSYMIKAVLSSKSDATIIKEIKTKVVFDETPVFRRISNINEWQTIMQIYGNQYENFLITGDIDFSKVDNPIVNIKANRIEGEVTNGVIPKLENLSINTTTNSTVLFAEVIGSIKNIEFENINIGNNFNYGNNIGIIGISHGEIDNVKFNNISITAQRANYVGAIGYSTSVISNVEMNNIIINDKTSGNYVGGLVGYSTNNVSNVTASNIVLNEETNLNISSCGGIAGYLITGNLKNITIDNFEIYGRHYVGSIAGYSIRNFETDRDLYVNMSDSSTRSIVKASGNYIGGMAGLCDTGYSWYDAFDNCKIKNVDVSTTGNYVGGLVGRMNAGNALNCTVEDITVKGDTYVGGVSGRNPVKYSNIKNIKVEGKQYVGGVSGYAENNSYDTITDSEIIGDRYIGGIVGSSSNCYQNNVVRINVSGHSTVGGVAGIITANTYITYCGITDSTVNATNVDGDSSLNGSDVGGIVGYADFRGITYSYVKDTSVTGVNNVGGLAGNVCNGYTQCNSTNATVTATGANAGGIFGYALSYKSGMSTPTTIINRMYFVGSVKAASNAGGIIGKFEKGTSLIDLNGNPISENIPAIMEPDNFYSIIISGKINSDDSNSSAWANSDSGNAGMVNYYRVYDGTKVNNKSVVLPDWNCTKAPDFVSSQELSNPKTYTDMGFYTNRWNFKGTNPLEKTNLVVIAQNSGLAGYDSNFIMKTDGLADGTYTVRINGSTVVNVDFSNGIGYVSYKINSAGKYNIKFSIDNQSDYSTTLNEFTVISSGQNVINVTMNDDSGTALSGYDFTVTPTVTLSGVSGTYKWYRSSTRNYQGVEIYDAVSNSQRLAGRGYYYASITTGSNTIYTPIYMVDTTCYMPYTTKEVITNGPMASFEEGFDDNKIPYDTEDDWYEGGIPVPQNDISMSGMFGMALMSAKTMDLSVPVPDIYTSGVDSINLEFDEEAISLSNNLEPIATFEVLCNGEPLLSQQIIQRVYSIKYDFKTPLTIVITKGDKKEKLEISPADFSRSIMTWNDSYYYIKSGGVQSTNGLIPGDYLHLYGGCAINLDGEVYNLADNSIVDSDVEIKLTDTTPLYTFSYDNSIIKTFKNFSIITNQSETVIRDIPLVIKNSKLYSIPTELPIVNDSVILDSYQSSEYFALLGTDGKIANILDEIVVPKDFKNYKIKEMTNTINCNTSIVLIRYSNGEIYGFNYLTGEKLNIESMISDVSLLDFAGDFLNSKVNSILKPSISSYYTMEVLKERLEIVPLDDSLINNSVEADKDGNSLSEDSAGSDSSEEGNESPDESGNSTETSQKSDKNPDGNSTSAEEVTDSNSIEEGNESPDESGNSTETSQKSDKNPDGNSTSAEEVTDSYSIEEGNESPDESGNSSETSQKSDKNTDGNSTSAEEVTDSNSSEEKYVIVYCKASNNFEVFKVEDLLSTKKNVMSENKKIEILESKNILIDSETLKIIDTIKQNVNGTIPFIVIVVVISGLLTYITIRKKSNYNSVDKYKDKTS